MTRITLVHPSRLCDQHLLAELRELPRIPNGVLTGRLKRGYADAPSCYTLGAGHVKFFVDKPYWLMHRYYALFAESVERNFQVVQRFPVKELGITGVYADYIPTRNEAAVNAARIRERMPPAPRYAGKKLDRQQAIELVADIQNLLCKL